MSSISNFLYNLDRAVASLGGAPPQETISSEVGRVANGTREGHFKAETWIAKQIAKRLDTDSWIWGQQHTLKAILHADQLNKLDDGKEQ